MTDKALKIGEIQDLVHESKALIAFMTGFIRSRSESKDPEIYEDEAYGFNQTMYFIDDKLETIDNKLDLLIKEDS